MHTIQQHIMKQLILADTCRFRDLKPDDIESNLFMYHLRCLIREKLVEKCHDGRYVLSPTGKDYAERMSLTIMKPRFQPRVVTLIVVTNSRGEYLLYRRTRQPLYGMVGFPYGKIHYGEKVAEAADRELADKAGVSTQLRHAGDGYVVIIENDHPISQIVYHLFCGYTDAVPHTDPIADIGPIGEAYWGRIEDIAPAKMIPSVPDLLELTQKSKPGKRFFAELTYKI